LNFDETLTPTLLLHFGAGLLDTRINDHSARFDSAAELGLTGTNSTLFPVIGAVVGAANSTLFENQGGMNYTTGAGNQIHLIYRKPTANTSLTWVRNNHTSKFGGEMRVDGYQMFNETYSMGWFNYSPNETGLPALNGVSLSSTVGFSYASFLMGRVDNGFDAVPAVTHMGAHSISGFCPGFLEGDPQAHTGLWPALRLFDLPEGWKRLLRDFFAFHAKPQCWRTAGRHYFRRVRRRTP
jgi:hypothetical protein